VTIARRGIGKLALLCSSIIGSAILIAAIGNNLYEEHLVDMLSDSQQWKDSAVRLARRGSDRAIRALSRAAIESVDEETCSFYLGCLKQLDRPWVLLQESESISSINRVKVLGLALQLGWNAAEFQGAILGALNSSEEEPRMATCDVLESIGPNGSFVTNDLVQLMAKHKDMSTIITRALAATLTEESVSEVLQLAGNIHDSEIVASVIMSIGQAKAVPDRAVMPHVKRYLRHTDNIIRRAVIAALSQRTLNSLEVSQVVKAMQEETDVAIKATMIGVLGAYMARHTEVIDVIQKVITDKDSAANLKVAGLYAFGTKTIVDERQYVSVLIPLVHDHDPEVVSAALLWLKWRMCCRQEIIAAAAVALHSTHRIVQRNSLELLWSIRPRRNEVPLIATELRSLLQRGILVEMAVTLIGTFKEEASSFMPDLLSLLSEDNGELAIQLIKIIAVADTDGLSIAELQRLIDGNTEPKVRAAAEKAQGIIRQRREQSETEVTR